MTVESPRKTVGRRGFLQLMGASMALVGLGGCGAVRRPEEQIVPYSQMPEHLIPGRAQYYASTFRLDNDVFGILVESHEGRPTKIEGNPIHPYSLGGTDVFSQASILDLYDPDRTTRPMMMDSSASHAASTWAAFAAYQQEQLKTWQDTKGAGVCFLLDETHSPFLGHIQNQLKIQFPNARWFRHAPLSDANALDGARIAFGRTVHVHPDYSKADVILSIGADFLGMEPGHVLASSQFTSRRRPNSPADVMNRLYVVESDFSMTGTMADHRIARRSSDIPAFAVSLAAALQAGVHSGTDKKIALIADDLLKAARDRRALIVCGRGQPPAVHAIVHAMNETLGAGGQTVRYTQSHETSGGRIEELANLMKAGKVSTLVLAGVNPAYDAPADFDFRELLKVVPETIHLGLHLNETARLCKWHLPMSHDLESWGDARSYDGTVGLIQPLIFPLYQSRSAAEFLSSWTNTADAAEMHTRLWNFWGTQIPAQVDVKHWRKSVHDGFIAGSAYADIHPGVRSNAVSRAIAALPPASDGIEIVFTPDARVFDGRFANNGWLQECPHPLTKMTWDNPAVISPKTAASLDIQNEDEVRITAGGRSMTIPVWILPGHADNSITLPLGGGRTNAGQVGTGAGFDTFALRASTAMDVAGEAAIEKTGKKTILAAAQAHDRMEGRPIIRHGTVDEYRQDPKFARNKVKHPPLESLFEEQKYDTGNQWAMTIDLNACTGCNACVVACQSENNIPVVGKEHVRTGREMQWLRLDRYFEEVDGEISAMTQPLPCQHCETAPCEQVCPAAATTHTTEGINDIVYNRCIGTRYCENNCPYKVRRFNYFNWTGADDLLQRGLIKELVEKRIYRNDPNGVIKMAQNPDVTVRSRGIMEKCTFCVQRIQRAKIDAKAEGKETVDDGAAVPACAQACPAQGIVFGNQNDPNSKVSKLRKLDRGYELLSELNVRPRVTYLAKIRNPNPQWT